MNTTTTQTLPKIVKFTGLTDAGEYGNATCPHCGAAGRYVYHFVCVDGSERGAMAGCLKRFPMHPFAKKHQAILEKKTPATWDTEILAAIDAYADGRMSEPLAALEIRQAESRRDAYRQRKFGYGRRK